MEDGLTVIAALPPAASVASLQACRPLYGSNARSREYASSDTGSPPKIPAFNSHRSRAVLPKFDSRQKRSLKSHMPAHTRAMSSSPEADAKAGSDATGYPGALVKEYLLKHVPEYRHLDELRKQVRVEMRHGSIWVAHSPCRDGTARRQMRSSKSSDTRPTQRTNELPGFSTT